MSRTFKEIYERLAQEKNGFTSLDPLDPKTESYSQFEADIQSSSKVANWRLLMAIVAVAQFDNEGLIDEVLQDVEDRIEDQGIGQLPWYVRIAKRYRHGYSLQFIDNEYRFTDAAQGDTNAAIVQFAAAEDRGGELRVKVANKDSNGVPQKLSQSEQNGVQDYINKIGPAGINKSVLSRAPDKLDLEWEVIYDPTVLTSSGELITQNNVFPVNEAINAYIYNLPFNGVLNLNELRDSVQQARGVRDPRLLKAVAREDGGSDRPLFDVTGSGPTQPENYRALAGHLTIDTLTVTYKSA
jgi:hypothetical protein